MARIRTVKPEFFTSLTIASLTVEARLTFIGLWTHSDDEGRCVDDTRLIRAALWPLDDRSFGDVEKDLSALADASLIVRYQVLGKRFLAVAGWSEHQKINRPSKSKIPPPPERPEPPPTSANMYITESSLHPHGDDPEDSLGERKGKEQGTGKGKELPATPGADAPSTPEAPTIGQRAKRITDDYHRVEPLSKWPAVNAIVMRALRTERYADDDIRGALLRLAADNRSVTVDSLRIELGPNASNVLALPVNGRNAAPNGRRPSATDRAVAEAMEVTAYFEALEQAEADQARKEITP